MSEAKKVHILSLGCPKNRVDSEVMLGHLDGVGYTHQRDAQGADVVVVNTCSFIGPAKEESVDAILEMAALKSEGKIKELVVAGCLSQRYAPELQKEIPEVDHFLGTGNFETIAEVLGHPVERKSLHIISSDSSSQHPRLSGKNKLVPFEHHPDPDAARGIHVPAPDFTIDSESPRIASQAHYSTYLKVSEGCSNTCTFCIIPKLRGPARSRSVIDIVAEAERMIHRGAVEISLIAQDLCAYGRDLSPKSDLATLLKALDNLEAGPQGELWIRCMYAYPKGLSDEVISVMKNAKHIIPYLDMPLQHIADPVLRAMKRGKGGESTWKLMRKLRQEIPNLNLRTTFITGFPGEREEDFEMLCEFVREIRFERMGVFPYSKEEDTPAFDLPDQIPESVAQQRAEKLMAIQKEISTEQQRAALGTRIKVLVEGLSEESDLLLQARHIGQAPEIDGYTYVTGGTASPGEIVEILVDQAGEYDIAGEIIVGRPKTELESTPKPEG